MRHVLDLDRWPLDDLGGAAARHWSRAVARSSAKWVSSVSTRSSDWTPSRRASPKRHRSSTPPPLPTPGITTSTLRTRSKASIQSIRPSGGSRPSTTRSAGTRSRGAFSRASTSAAARRLPGDGDGEVQALPDGGPAGAHQRHGLPRGGAAQLALRPGRVHNHRPAAGAGIGRRVPVSKRSQERVGSELQRGSPSARRSGRARADPSAPTRHPQRLQGQEHCAPGDAVEGDRPRLVAVFSYYETPGFAFSDAERLGFYGRTAPTR